MMNYDVCTTIMVFMLSQKNCPQAQKGSNTSSGISSDILIPRDKIWLFKMNCIMWNQDTCITNRTIRQFLNKGRSLQVWDFRRWHFPNNDSRKRTTFCWWEERWSWSVSLQTQYYSTCRRILLVNPVIFIYLCEAKTNKWLWRYV